MARILEALKRTEVARQATEPAAAEPLPRVVTAADDVIDRSEETPFIEIGGSCVEGSASVLAVPLPKRKPAHALGNVAAAPQPLVMLKPMAHSDGACAQRNPIGAAVLAYHQPEHPISKQYETLAAQLTEGAATRGQRVLMFPHTGLDANAAVVVANLAVALARCGAARVVTVDAAGASPSIASLMGVAPAPGLLEILTGAVPVARAVQTTVQRHLEVIAGGSTRTEQYLPVKSMRAILGTLRNRYSCVLVATAGWTETREMVALSAACDAVYLVVPYAQADTAPVNDIIQGMVRQGVCLRGCILAQQ